jgi:hypothetical protein
MSAEIYRKKSETKSHVVVPIRIRLLYVPGHVVPCVGNLSYRKYVENTLYQLVMILHGSNHALKMRGPRSQRE